MRNDGVTLALLSVPLLVFPLLFWSRLPDPVATHFGAGGEPDGNLGKIVWVVGTLAVMGVTWAIYRATRAAAPFTWRGPVTFGAFGVLVVAQLAIVSANVDAESWRLAEAPDIPWVLVIAAAWVIFGGIAYFLERR